MKCRIFVLVLLVMVLAGPAVYDWIDRCSCICYQVTGESHERQISQEITSIYESHEGVMSLTRLTCRHHRTMWLKVFWDQGTYQIVLADV